MKTDATAAKKALITDRCRKLVMAAEDGDPMQYLLGAVFSRLSGVEMTKDQVDLLRTLADVPADKVKL